ncbi:MAG: CHAT domain-containing protein [Actinomycetota bacterium]|nr:CHAT domain-containing protein [Actinomycetota bacterium]
MATADDPRVEATAWQVIGLAQHELGHLTEAVTSYQRAIATSADHGLADLEATSRAHLATAFLSLGDAAGAERQIAAATAGSSPLNRGVVAMRHGVVLQRTGRLSEALVVYQRAQRWLEEVDDEPFVALVHLNRGILYAYQGKLSAALESLSLAEHISRKRNLPVLVAMATHNMGFALGRLGKLPDALAAFARTEDAYAALGNPARLVAVLEADRSEMLLQTGMIAEAQASALRAVDALVSVGDQAHLIECRLLLAQALLAGGDYRAAAAEATQAAKRFTAASRLPWAALARYVAIQAEILQYEDQGAPPPGLLRRCQRIAAELDAQGWPVESVHVRTVVGRMALALGRPALARAELSHAVAARTRGTADLRAQAWHAAALLRLAEGNRGGAKRALSRGMAVVDEYRASLGATELRAHAASHGTDLARLGMRLALEEGRAVDVLRWAERWRACALQRRSVRPPDDERLAAALTDLRNAQAELRSAALGATETRGARNPPRAGAPGWSPETAALRAQIAELERSVRTQTLQAQQAQDDTAATGRVDVDAVRMALGDRWLAEYVSFEGKMYVVTVTRQRVRLHRLGAVPVEEEKRYLLFAIRRLLSSRSRGPAEQALASTARRLDEILIAPLGIPHDQPLVVVPTGVLHGLPWATLPSVARRPTTVAPSAALWVGYRAPSRPNATAPMVALIAGPQLPGADEEVRQLAELYPEAQSLTGSEATASAVMSALSRAEIAHLAAHGRFRSDSPLFSSVLLADGPLTVYDLERLRRGPRTVVLAACDAAVSAVRTGDELLGTAAALIGLGVRSVVAPVMPVPDGSTAPFMIALHRRIQLGETPAEALVTARTDQDLAVGAAFICIGSDDARASELSMV